MISLVMLPVEVTGEWRAKTLERMRVLGLTISALAVAIGTSTSALEYALTKARRSTFVPIVDGALSSMKPTSVNDAGDPIGEIAALRESRDAVDADLVRLETARASIEERIVEAYEHRARLDIEIRRLRTTK